MVQWGIRVPIVPWRPIFEKSSHLREKGWVLILFETTLHLEAKAQYQGVQLYTKFSIQLYVCVYTHTQPWVQHGRVDLQLCVHTPQIQRYLYTVPLVEIKLFIISVDLVRF
jgi:hypothetical protein